MLHQTSKVIKCLLFSILIIVSSLTVSAQDEETTEPAEVVGTLDVEDGRIPAIKVGDWTVINVTVKDVFGINWTRLNNRFPIRSVYIWPLIHPSWKPFLGYTSLQFETEVIEGNPRGWIHKVTPNGISNANQGRTYDLQLSVKADDIAVDYAVVIGIKATRINLFGEVAGVSYIYIPVKSSALNNIKMNAQITKKETPPKSYVTFDAQVSNYGYYRDMFQLEFETDKKLNVSSENQLIVLESGDSQKIRITVLTPEKLFDQGTPYTIDVYATSSGDPIPVKIHTFVVVSKGMYVSPLAAIIATPIILLLVVFYVVFIWNKNKQDRLIRGKPDKPWDIPEEQEYLKKLKEKDSEEYQKVMEMMKQEYESALLWWKSTHQKEQDNNFSFSNILSKLSKKVKKEEKTTEPAEPKDEVKETEQVKKKSKKSSKKKVEKQPIEQKEKSSKNSNQKFEAKTIESSDQQQESVSNKIVNGLKKWFTVPEEEKQKKQEIVEEKEATKKTEVVSTEEQKEKPKDDYEQELKRIENEQRKKRAQKEKEQKRLEKQKALNRIKRAQEKQKNKLNK